VSPQDSVGLCWGKRKGEKKNQVESMKKKRGEKNSKAKPKKKCKPIEEKERKKI